MTMEDRMKSHYESLSRCIGFTSAADAKAAPVLALQIALAGTLAARFENLVPRFAAETWSLETAVLAALLAAYVVFVALAVWTAASVFVPLNPRTGESLIYFEDIAAMSHAAFTKRSRDVGLSEMEEQILSQIHTVSQIASKKMRRVRRAFQLSMPSLVLWIVLLLFGEFPVQNLAGYASL